MERNDGRRHHLRASTDCPILARARIGKRVAAGVQGNGLAALYLFEKSEACGCNCPEESVHCQWPSNAGGVTCVYGPRAASLPPCDRVTTNTCPAGVR